jgi:hypothetical protein
VLFHYANKEKVLILCGKNAGEVKRKTSEIEEEVKKNIGEQGQML